MASAISLVESGDDAASWFAQFRTLLRAKVYNMRPRKRGRLGRALLLIAFGSVMCVGAYKASCAGTRFLIAIDPEDSQFGLLIVRRIVELGLLFLFSILGVSSLISSLTGFFLARDLELLHTLPVNTTAFYLARLAEVVFQSSWVLLPLIVPSLWGVGVGLDASVLYYLGVPFAVLSLIIPVCAATVMLVTFISSLIPATRVREFFMVLSGFLFVGAYIVVRAARPEQFIHPDRFRSLPELLDGLGVGNPYLPSAWATDALLWSSGQPLEQGLRSIFLLLLLVIVMAGVGRLLHGHFYERAKSRAREVKPSLTKRAEWLVKCFVFLGRMMGRKGIDRAMISKEAKLVLRDPQQWTQILMLFALMVLFVYNFRFVDELKLPESVEVFFCLLVSGFVLGALGARFVFPMVSLESSAFWILRTAPIPTSKILAAKAWSAFIALGTLGVLMAIAASWALGFGLGSTLLSVLLVGPLAVFTSVLGVGLGGSYPRFKFENPLMIPMSYGGMIYMYWSMGTLLVYSLALIWPLYVLYHPLARGDGLVWVLTILLAILALMIPVVSGWIGFKMGCHRLKEAYETQ